MNTVEQQIITQIIQGKYSIHEPLLPERELAKVFGVGRPTIREALKQLEGDGWVTVRKGKPPLVKDFWREGNLHTIANIINISGEVPNAFIIYLLQLRSVITPVFIREAIEHQRVHVVSLLSTINSLDDTPETYAQFDWKFQKGIAELSSNPLYLLLLNHFDSMYVKCINVHYQEPKVRKATSEFYQELIELALDGNGRAAEGLVKETMVESMNDWKQLNAVIANP
jgi:GntR family transcriptional regulator, negative regulator for fad regulon and positive regulator of fabA